MSRRADHLRALPFGFLLGFALSRSGFSEWHEIHRMWSLGLLDGGPGPGDLRLLLAYGAAVVVAMVGFRTLADHDKLPALSIHRGTVVGGLLFGAGWGLAGACPGAALVQLGEGKLGAAVSIAGMLGGMWVARILKRRLRLSSGTCLGE